MSIRVDIKGRDELLALAGEFNATEAQVQAALRSTFGKMARWLRTVSVRGLSHRLKIPSSVLRSRLRTYRMAGGINGGGEAKVWFGLRDVPLSRLKPRATSKGVTAGGRFVEGGFIAKLFGRLQVLKRAGKGRVPLVVQYAKIYDESVTYIEDELIGNAAFDAKFFKILEHELKWRTRILK